MKASDLLVKCLENEGVKFVFGVPGEENEDLLFSLAESSIQFIPTRHEQGAAFMADVWGRLTGHAGVCLSTLGPGATNLLTGVADAQLDKAPLVAITGQGSSKRLHKESHQLIDIVNLFKPITKWNVSINHADVIPEVVRKAFKLAEAEKPGATHFELPEDIAKTEVDGVVIPKYRVRRSAPDYKALHEAFNIIKTSQRPLIIAGNGAIRKLAAKHLRELVAQTQIPVVATFMGKGAVSDQAPQSLFTLGVGFTIIVLNDNDYGLISWKQKEHRGQAVATTLTNPDFKKYAESFGIKGYRPETALELRRTLKEVIIGQELSVIEIAIDSSVNLELNNRLNNL